MEITKFRIRDIFENILTMFKEKASKHNIQIKTEIKNNADIEIQVDERKIKQVLLNLVHNAIKFTPDNGSIIISGDTIMKNGRKYIEITVADTGIGIKKEDIDKLFNPFSQIETTYTKKFEGTGLGLALCKKFVEMHGGEIRCESEYGKGSRFIFNIPVSQEKETKNEV